MLENNLSIHLDIQLSVGSMEDTSDRGAKMQSEWESDEFVFDILELTLKH